MRVPKEDWGFLNEKAFEAALQASVPERLPDKVAAVTPWKRAMGRVLARPDRDESLGTELPFARHRAGADATGLPAPAAGGDQGLSWGHTDGGQRSGVRPGGRLLPKQRLQPAVHNRGRGKADGRACRIRWRRRRSLRESKPWAVCWQARPRPSMGQPPYSSGRYTSRMSCGAPPERSPAGFCTIGAGRPSGRPTTLWRRIPPLRISGHLWTAGHFRDIFGTFSLSTAAQHGRGYVVYAADEIPHAEYRKVPDSRFHYSYPYRFLQYPAKTALENRMSDHGAFRTVWSDLRYGPEVTPPVIKKNDQRNDPPAKAGGSFRYFFIR